LSGSEDCTAAATQFVFTTYKPVTEVVIQLATLSGGTSPSVQFRLLAVH